MDEKLLSIIVPVYNVELYVQRCLDSILCQNNKKIEIIIINDGSTDLSGSICENYARDYSNIHYIEQSNKGLSEARNVGIKNSSGKYILFLDSDDYLEQGIICELLNIITDCKSDFILGKAKTIDEQLATVKHFCVDYSNIKYTNPAHLFKMLNSKKNFWFAAWLIIINRKFLINEKLLFKRGIFHEDELWVPQVFVKADSVYLWNVEFYCYQENRENSITNSVNIKKAFDRILVMDGLIELASQYPKKRNCIYDRLASLEWGLIILSDNFIYYKEYDNLYKGIEKRLKYLRYGKYFIVNIYVSFFGLRSLIYLLRVLRKKKYPKKILVFRNKVKE